MIIGVPKEIKDDEYRVALAPAGAEMLAAAGHQVLFETGAGFGSGFTDESYANAGAELVRSAAEVWARAEMITKVKEPIEPEWPLMKGGQVIFTYFHFAASEVLTRAVVDSGAIAIAYETVELKSGELPLLTPMSEIAGRMAVQEGAKYLERPQGGLGVLLGGVPGVLPGKVLILGAGVVGTNAAKVAAGLGARVCIMDIDLERLRYLDDVMPANVHTLFSTRQAIRQHIRDADVIIGAVLVTGAKAPKLVTEDDLSVMRAGTVIVDVAVDQGGCVETIRPTTHQDPVYTVDGVMHYGVANMPGGVPRSSTFALTNATLPYQLALADKGWKRACLETPALEHGVNVASGHVTHSAVADAFGMQYTRVRDVAVGPKLA
jgi:alanine dehydrogenase